MLVGQAPGKTEVHTRRPFSGPAGNRLEGWLARAGLGRDDVYFAALARCFPGEKPGGGDRPPSQAMLSNCREHLLREFEILRPEVVIPVGGMVVRELLGISRLDEAVGKTHHRDGATYLPLPHPSGASTWTNYSQNRELLETALELLGERVSV
jgi:uracil-DNA glycosylase